MTIEEEQKKLGDVQDKESENYGNLWKYAEPKQTTVNNSTVYEISRWSEL